MNVEQRARELLATELDSDERRFTARQIRAGKTPSTAIAQALRAIARALEQPEGREAVAWMICYPDGDRRAALSPETSSPGATVRPLVYGDTTPPAEQPEAQAELHRRVAAVEALSAAGWRWNGTFWDFPPQQAEARVGGEARGFDAWWKSLKTSAEEPEMMSDRDFAKAAWDAALAAAQQPKEGA